MARGRYIAAQDADDVSLPDRIERKYDYLEAHPDTIMVGSSFYASTLDQISPLYVIPVPIADEQIREMIVNKNPFCHGSTLIRTDVLRKIPYNENVRAGVDYELWSRLISEGKLANLPMPPEYVLRAHERSAYDLPDG